MRGTGGRAAGQVLCVPLRGQQCCCPWKTGVAADVLVWTGALQRAYAELLSPPGPHQQPWNIKADRLRFQSCDFSAPALARRKIISKLNVGRCSGMVFNNIGLCGRRGAGAAGSCLLHRRCSAAVQSALRAVTARRVLLQFSSPFPCSASPAVGQQFGGLQTSAEYFRRRWFFRNECFACAS